MCYDIGKPWKHNVKIFRGGQSKEMESRLVGAQRWRPGNSPQWLFSNYGVSFGGAENVLDLHREVVAQHRECTKHHKSHALKW